MVLSIETITPEMARKYLATSPYNRVTKSTEKVARNYAEAMKRGEWQLNGECIVFDKEGRLMNGHHRCMGVCIANVPVSFCVCRGVDRDAFTTYNCGLRTNLAQVLGMKGVKNNNLIMAIIGIDYNLKNTGRLRINNGMAANYQRTITSDVNLYYLNKADYDEAAETANRLRAYGNIIKNTWIGGVYYFLTHTGGYNPVEVLPFFEALCHIETSGITPCDSLKGFIIRHRMNNIKVDDSYLAALLMKAWNAYITGRDVKCIRFNPDKESYPKFILKA